MKGLWPVLTVLLLSGCLKTAEQVRRERHMDDMGEQLKDSQNLVADLTVMLKSLQQQIDQLNGKIEEVQHQQGGMKTMHEDLMHIQQQVTSLTETQKTQSTELTEQRGFIEKVTAKLGQLSSGSSRSSTPSKKNTKDDIQEARALIKKHKWDEARPILESVLNDGETSAADRNKAMHALGLLEYGRKNYDKALVFFSKIYTKYPKSSLAPDSLLHIGLSLQHLGKKSEAQQAFEEVKNSYPGTSSAKEASRAL